MGGGGKRVWSTWSTFSGSHHSNNWPVFGVGQSRDADGDGVPDWWEQQYFGSTTNCAPEADPDGDGMPSLFEYLADTNPTQNKAEG